MNNLIKISKTLEYFYNYNFAYRFEISITDLVTDISRCIDLIDVNTSFQTALYFKTDYTDNIYPLQSNIPVLQWTFRYITTRKCICTVIKRILKYNYGGLISGNSNMRIINDLEAYLNKESYKRDDDYV